MRHFLGRKLAPPVSLPARVSLSPTAGALVLGTRAAQRLATPDLAAVPRAVDLAVIARRAHMDFPAAEGAGKDSRAGLAGRLAINLPRHRDDRILRPAPWPRSDATTPAR